MYLPVIQTYFFCVCMSRYLTSKQKELIQAFAELEDDVSGTVNGVDKNNSNKGIIVKHILNIRITFR